MAVDDRPRMPAGARDDRAGCERRRDGDATAPRDAWPAAETGSSGRLR